MKEKTIVKTLIKQLSTGELILFRQKRQLNQNDHQFRNQFNQLALYRNIQFSNFVKT